MSSSTPQYLTSFALEDTVTKILIYEWKAIEKRSFSLKYDQETICCLCVKLGKFEKFMADLF